VDGTTSPRNLIAFNGNVLTIPAECGTGRQSVSPANGKTLAQL